eukprot:CAMPEP_0117450252 /NCGR_PEP_ID=MMETSP0759-20121206/8369_1 /TAXON_ID=63605 /ORGANISM="Percolomonas cosmopolitus, Strain WS" /LENGTH=172 /DNA_ID=CAMNT_0005242761 /DNA_START=102 /DNA_END=620 /DNA_ORIENTATION=+
MPLRIRNFKTPNFYRFMQPSRGGNQPHTTYYAFWLRDPIAMIGTGLMFVIPLFWVCEGAFKNWRRSKNLAADLDAPYTGLIIVGSKKGDWSEKRYGDGTDVGASFEMTFSDGSVQKVQDYPKEYEEYANFIDRENKKYERDAERMRELQQQARDHRRSEWLRLHAQQQQQQA